MTFHGGSQAITQSVQRYYLSLSGESDIIAYRTTDFIIIRANIKAVYLSEKFSVDRDDRNSFPVSLLNNWSHGGSLGKLR